MLIHENVGSLVGQDALRGEMQQRAMYKDHIRSITHVVKTLSQELDATEARCMSAISSLRHAVSVCIHTPVVQR